MGVYVVDSNFFIQTHRESYPLDIAFSFWKKVKQLADKGRIISIDKVKNEIYDKNDALEAFSIGLSPLGVVNDPLFGYLKADFISNMMWGQIVSFSSNVDSVQILDLTLQLYYDSVVYGDQTKIDFEVYEVIKDISDSLKSDTQVTPDMINPIPINIGKPARLTDTTIYTVKLSNDYAKKFIDPEIIKDSSYFYYDTFRIHLKGLYIKAKSYGSTGGGLIKVSHTISVLTLRTLEKGDTVSNIFYLANPNYKKAVHINMYTGTLSPEVNTVMGDTLNIHPFAYIQALYGPKVLVKFPTLPELRNQLGGQIIVNKAELILPFDKEKEDTIDKFNAPPYLGVHDKLTNNIINDDGLIVGYIGGIYNSTKNEYRINIGNHIHSYFQDVAGAKTSNELYLFAADFMYASSTSTVPITIYSLKTPGRGVLYNTNTTTPPLLKIIYTKIPK